MNIEIFNFENQKVEILLDEQNNPWWIAADICNLLEITNTTNALRTIPDKNKLTFIIERAGQKRSMNAVNESGLYRLISKSNKEIAIKFQDWLYEDVIPTIRKTGSYSIGVPKTYLEALHECARLEEKRLSLEAQIEQDRPKVEFANSTVTNGKDMPLGVWGHQIGIGEGKIFDILFKHGFLKWRGNIRVPISEYGEMKKGWFKLKQRIDRPYWNPKVMITGQGRLAIHSHLVALGYIDEKPEQLALFD